MDDENLYNNFFGWTFVKEVLIDLTKEDLKKQAKHNRQRIFQRLAKELPKEKIVFDLNVPGQVVDLVTIEYEKIVKKQVEAGIKELEKEYVK